MVNQNLTNVIGITVGSYITSTHCANAPIDGHVFYIEATPSNVANEVFVIAYDVSVNSGITYRAFIKPTDTSVTWSPTCTFGCNTPADLASLLGDNSIKVVTSEFNLDNAPVGVHCYAATSYLILSIVKDNTVGMQIKIQFGDSNFWGRKKWNSAGEWSTWNAFSFINS